MDHQTINALLVALMIFLIGMSVGGFFADWLNRKLRTTQAKLGAEFSEMLDQVGKPVAFVGEGMLSQATWEFGKGPLRFTIKITAKQEPSA